MTEKTEETQRGAEANWTCADCGTPKRLSPGARYHQCEGCGTVVKLAWHGDKLDSRATQKLRPDPVDERLATEVLQERAQRSMLVIRELNSRIRNIETSKGGERIIMLAVFILLSFVVYLHFIQSTMVPLDVTDLPSQIVVFATILGTLVVFSISALVAVWLHRRRLIRNVNKFYQDKAASERDLESSEAALAIRGIELPDVSFRQPEPESEEEENDDSDIISKFVSRQRQYHKRLSLRSKPSGRG